MNQTVVATQAFGPPWTAGWNSATVPDGTYMLQSVLHDGAGNVAYSSPVTVTVANPATTSVVSPSQGAWVSGSTVRLDATTSDSWGPGVTKVEFHLSGGSLNNALVATAASPTSSSWLANWDSTTVPDGTYYLQSDAYDANGNQGLSSAVTIIVQNTPPTTSVLIPSSGTQVSGGAQMLDASASPGVSSVTYEITGGSLSNQDVATATHTNYGWIGYWNTTAFPNGDYTLQSVASYPNGVSAPSAPVTITVNNPPPTTSVLTPSSGATVSGGAQILDASASPGVTAVTYELTGGSLTDQVVATATPTYYGWISRWNTTGVPNGSYTLQSVASYPDGVSAPSAPLTITVAN